MPVNPPGIEVTVSARREPGERYTCRCGAEVVQARSRHGNSGPVTLRPPESGKGNVLLFKAADGVLSYAVVPGTKAAEPDDAESVKAFRRWLNDNRELRAVLRLNHFADCPRAREFKKEEKDDPDGE